MRLPVASLAVSFFLLACQNSGAQETPNSSQQQQQQRPRRAVTADPDAPAGPLVNLDVVFIDRPVGDVQNAATVPPAGEILQSEKQGKLDRVMRVRLSTLSGRRATVQFGERVPTVSGRSAGGRGGFATAQRETPDPQPRFTYAYTMEHTGTLINATPQVEEGGAVLVELQVERSRLAELPRQSDEDRGGPDIARQKMVTLTGQSTLRLKPGEPALAEGYAATGEGARVEFIVVTATVEPAPARSAAAERKEPERQLRVFRLVTAQAHDVLPLLEKIIGSREVRFAVDEATNTVVASGPSEQLSIAEALLQRLDEGKK